MRRQLQQNKEAVLESFWKQCGFTEDYLQPVQTNYSADMLQSGLLFLEQVSLLPLCKTDAPLHLFHGTTMQLFRLPEPEYLKKQQVPQRIIIRGSCIFPGTKCTA